MRGPAGQDYRYVITVDRNDEPVTRVLAQGHLRRADAQLAYTSRILDARKKFRMPNDPLPRIDTRSDRRGGVLHAVKVGPETIILRRRNPSDGDIAPPPAKAPAPPPKPLGARVKRAIANSVIWLVCFAILMSIEIYLFGGVIADDGSTFGVLVPCRIVKRLFGG